MYVLLRYRPLQLQELDIRAFPTWKRDLLSVGDFDVAGDFKDLMPRSSQTRGRNI